MVGNSLHIHRERPNPMKIGTLLTAAIVSLAAVGGGLAVYVAATKYQTMDQVSVARRRLEIARAVGDIPRYLNPERGFATNILMGPPAVDPKLRAELDKYRKQTDGARDKMNEVKSTLPGAFDDAPAVMAGIDALNVRFATLREAIDKAIDGPADTRKDAAKKIVSDNAVFNNAVTTLLDGQVRKIALLDGDAYRQASYANIAWTLRDVGGFNASLHKNLVGAKRAATEAVARQCLNAGQCGDCTWQDERGLCRAFRQRVETGEGRRRQRQI